MRTAANLLRSTEKINIHELAQAALMDSSVEYIHIQQEQMSRGERSDGKPIFNLKTGRDEYSPGYAIYKGKTKPIDLHDTGDFYAGIKIEPATDGINVDSQDWKSGTLQRRYGTQIFTLNDESKAEFKPIAGAALISLVEKELNKQ